MLAEDNDSIVILNSDTDSVQAIVNHDVNTQNQLQPEDVDNVEESYSIINLEVKESNSGSMSSGHTTSTPGCNVSRSSFTQEAIDSITMNTNKNQISYFEQDNYKDSIADFKLDSSCREGSLAADFLTGERQKDMLEASIFKHFPSITNSFVSKEEIAKLQIFMAEYVLLKDTVKNNNNIIKQYFTSIQKWKAEAEAYKEYQLPQINSFEETVAKLRNENLELKKELESKLEHLKVFEGIMKEENSEIIKHLSEKSAHIDIMKTQIEKLEANQLRSYEVIKRKSDSESSNGECEYITTAEHKQSVKNFELQLSVLKAKNIQFEELKEKFKGEINLLKIQLKECEDLLKQAKSDIKILQDCDSEKSILFKEYTDERDKMQQEIQLLKTQIDIYAKDYHIEKLTKDEMCRERDAILSDLKLLQERNQSLIEDAQQKYEAEKLAKAGASSSPIITGTFKKNNETGTKPKTLNKTESNEPAALSCPVCNIRFDQLDRLEVHVQVCLDQQINKISLY